MTRAIVVFLWITLLSLSETEAKSIQRKIDIPSQLNFPTSVFLVEKDGAPEFYMADIDVPVCSSGVCFNAEIKMYWDVFGHFLKFQLPENMHLTKKDHEPFQLSDYRLLHSILLNKNSSIKNYTEGDILEENEVDGYSGASAAVDFNYVPDAIMSSFTLWHIANGITSYLKKYTLSHYQNQMAIKDELEGVKKRKVNNLLFGYMQKYNSLSITDIAQIVDYLDSHPRKVGVITEFSGYLAGQEETIKAKMLLNLILSNKGLRKNHKVILENITIASLKQGWK